VVSTQSAIRAKKQATDGNLKFNLLVDRNNEVGKAFGVVYTFPKDLNKMYVNLFKNNI
jgi:peroxiredoxin